MVMSGHSIHPQWNCEGMRKAYQGLGGMTGSCFFNSLFGATTRKSARSMSMRSTSQRPRRMPAGLNQPVARPVSSPPMACPGQPVLEKFATVTERSGLRVSGPNFPSTFSAWSTAWANTRSNCGPATQAVRTRGRKTRAAAYPARPSTASTRMRMRRRLRSFIEAMDVERRSLGCRGRANGRRGAVANNLPHGDSIRSSVVPRQNPASVVGDRRRGGRRDWRNRKSVARAMTSRRARDGRPLFL